MSDAAEALLELAWAERRIAAEGRLDELAPLHAERDRLMTELPVGGQGLSPSQVVSLQRALAVQGEVADLLRATRDAVAAELTRVDQGRTTLRGYAPAGVQSGPVFDQTG